MTDDTAKIINEIKLFKEYLYGQKSDATLTVWNGIQILSLMEKTLFELQKTNDMLQSHIEITKAY